MVTDDGYFEVFFDQYCKTCKYEKEPEIDSPCEECLGHPTNLYSCRPVRWEAK